MSKDSIITEDCTNLVNDQDCIQRELPEEEYCQPCRNFAAAEKERESVMHEEADAIAAHGGIA
jgi:hypothetical protein